MFMTDIIWIWTIHEHCGFKIILALADVRNNGNPHFRHCGLKIILEKPMREILKQIYGNPHFRFNIYLTVCYSELPTLAWVIIYTLLLWLNNPNKGQYPCNSGWLTLACSLKESTMRRSTLEGLEGSRGTTMLLALDTFLPGFCRANSASVC